VPLHLEEYKDVTINLRVGETLEQFLFTSGVKQGDNLAPSLDKKWEFETPGFRWHPDTQDGEPRGQLCGIKHSNLGTKFSFFNSFYVDDTALILLSRGELVTALKLVVSHFRRFGLTIHTGVRSKKRRFETEVIHFPGPVQKSSAADTEDIDIEDRFMSFCIQFKYLGTFFVPELSDTADITLRIIKARNLFNSMNKQVLSNKKIR
jgi:hypothetical protein